ncbi:MAG: hypothetical protein KGQ16_14740, partial [Cyanobacteria bacterium REEB444]|nr:hypothetical protein [Cyanobacteria bacterium REEB444]
LCIPADICKIIFPILLCQSLLLLISLPCSSIILAFICNSTLGREYEYVVNGKSAIEWIMERYQVSTHKESGIVNDPNDWANEVGNPRYILDLLLSIINVSVQTVDIVNCLPKVDFGTEPTHTNVVKMYPTREADEQISMAAEPDNDEYCLSSLP